VRRSIAVALLLVAACTWSNSLYQARVMSEQAVTAERERRTGEAQQLWGQVIVKADSAYARSPGGERGAEALWLAGHAAVESHDCGRAIPRLQSAMSAGPTAVWRQQLLFELAQCEETVGGPTAVSLYATLMASTRDPVVLHRARLRAGHALVLRGEWQPALDMLAGEDTITARLDRATALAELGHGSQALAELTAPLAAADTSVKWLGYIEALSRHDSRAADSLLDDVLAMERLPQARRAAWLLIGAQDALEFDPAAADRRLRRLATFPASVSVNEGRALQLDLRLRRASSVAALRAEIDSINRGSQRDDGAAVRTIAGKLRLATQLVDQNDHIPAAAPDGDLTLFALAESARDSLHAPDLAASLFARLERDWPRSPYAAKALMARGPLEPDSAAILLARLRLLRDNPYVTAADGDPAGQVRVVRLEDSLRRHVAQVWARKPTR
jgi:hypothetical protein